MGGDPRVLVCRRMRAYPIQHGSDHAPPPPPLPFTTSSVHPDAPPDSPYQLGQLSRVQLRNSSLKSLPAAFLMADLSARWHTILVSLFMGTARCDPRGIEAGGLEQGPGMPLVCSAQRVGQLPGMPLASTSGAQAQNRSLTERSAQAC